MPGDRVITGVLRNIGFRIPTWVLPPHPRSRYNEHVYVRLPNRHGLSAHLEELVHMENDITVEGFRCYIPIPNNIVLTASLEPYDFDLHYSSNPRIFVRIPFQNRTIYTGMIHRGYSFPANRVY